MAYQLFQLPKQVNFDSSAQLLSGAKAYFYLTGTTTPQTVYTDSALSVAHANPVVADSAGVLPAIYLDPSIQYKLTLTTSDGSLLYTVDPINDQIISSTIIGQAIYARTSAEIAASVTPSNYLYPPLDIRRYGAVLNGVTDDSSAWQKACNVMAASSGTLGGEVFAPAGTSLISTQVVINSHLDNPQAIRAYGCRIITSGAIRPFAITGSTSTIGIAIYGLRVDHQSDSTALGAFDVYGAQHVHFHDCDFTPGTNASYVAIRFRQSTAADNNTGSFWGRVVDCIFKRSGSRAGMGVQIVGSSNAVSVTGSSFNGITTAIQCTYDSGGDGSLPNATLVMGNSFEDYTTAIDSLNGGSTPTCQTGLRIIGNRFENGTTVFSYSPTLASDPAVPPFLLGNYLVSSSGTYIVNANARSYSSLDFSTTPAIAGSAQISTSKALAIAPTSGTVDCLDLTAPATGQGAVLRNNSGTVVSRWQYRAGGGSKLDVSGLHVTAATPTAAAGEIALGTTTGTTVGAAGGASSLPATPLGYWTINIAGTNVRIPYYN